MTQTKKILEQVLQEIALPASKLSSLNILAKNLIKNLKKHKITSQIGGSLAKGTMIKTFAKPDVDIFVVFDYSEEIVNLGKVLKKLKLPGKLKLVHGSRDYFQIDCKDSLIELIPVVKNFDPTLAENVTDVSLSHVKYVKGKIRKNPKLAKEIMLAKAFARANSIYGAESYIKGFSGYSLEVLIIHFGSFLKFLKNAGKRKVIDPNKVYRGQNEIFREINSSKLQGPLILIDPTNPIRNASAGLSGETFEKFLKVAKEFLKKPSKKFFEKQKLDIEKMKKLAGGKNAKFLEISLSTKKQEGDIAGTKMKKFFDFFEKELIRKGQGVLQKEFTYSGSGKNSKGYLIIKENKEIVVKGPSRGLEEAAKKFKKARGKSAFLKGKFWYAREKTSVKNIFENVKRFEKEMGVKSEY